MKPEIDALFVHYHSGPWLADAVRALREDWAASGLAGRIVVVDNGSTPGERAGFSALDVTLLEAGSNLGFAAAVNLGVAATTAPHLLLVNPDVQVAQGCCRALLQALAHGAAVAGPRFFWDDAHHFQLPPTEPLEAGYRMLRMAGERNQGCLRLARQRWRQHARRIWRTTQPVDCFSLSGALLAIQRAAWSAVGPFDESFFMYYEETDWLQRVRRHGLSARFVPEAQAVHYCARSTPEAEAAGRHMRASEQLFFDRRFGKIGHRLLQRGAAWLPATAGPALPVWDPQTQALARPGEGEVWVEVSPRAEGFPAAGHLWRPEQGTTWRMPDATWRTLTAGPYVLMMADQAGREFHPHAFTKSA